MHELMSWYIYVLEKYLRRYKKLNVVVNSFGKRLLYVEKSDIINNNKDNYFMRWKMAASYKKLFKMLIDREMKSKDLAAKAGISPATLAKMKKDGAVVSSEVLVKICTALGCTLDDIVEIIHNEEN